MSDIVRIEVTDGVAVVVLDDPDRRNAVSEPLNAALVEAFDDFEAGTDVRSVVLTGAGPAFSAGGDLAELEAARSGDDLRRIYRGFVRVAHSRLPTIAAVNGPAVGAGMNLALACDVILAGASARFDTGFLRLGIHPGGGHTWRLAGVTDVQTVKAMVLFGQALDGAEAERAGLAWRCVPDDDLRSTALDLARRAAGFDPELTARTKATIAEMAGVADSAESIDTEVEPQVWSMLRPVFREGLAAMRARISTR